MAKITFTARKYGNATKALFTASTAIEKVAEANSKAINAWAQLCAAGLLEEKLDIATIRADIAKAHGVENFSDLKGTAVYVRFYALQSCHKHGALPELLDGKALMTVYRSLSAPNDGVDGKGKGKGKGKGNGGGKGKARAITLETALEALNAWLDQAIAGDAEMARGLAKNADLALVIAKVGKLQAVIAADAKANAPKPVPAKPLPKGKAKTSVRLVA